MKIAFYAPLKAPDHPVPSGDRLMARMIIACLQRAGHEVDVASELRAFVKDPEDVQAFADLQREAVQDVVRLSDRFRATGAPDLWFTYHPYYKAPDLIGPPLCKAWNRPYVTAESSYSARRNLGIWVEMQARVLAGTRQAAVNICMTARDEAGLAAAAPQARFARLRPFIDTAPFTRLAPRPEPFRLVCVAMMRPGAKLDSYTHLSRALSLVPDLPWRLSIIGDGPLRGEVEALFAGFAPGRVEWHGQLDIAGVAEVFARSALYAWPGCGEAYGLAYLEAQAAGLPVLAYRSAGVPEVVADGVTGRLVPALDPAAYASALADLLIHEDLRKRLAGAAAQQVLRHHSIATATATLDQILRAQIRGAT